MRRLKAGFSILLMLLVVACTPQPTTIRVELNDYKILPARMEVKAGATVRLEVVNWARQPHSLVVQGIDNAATFLIQPLRYEVVTFKAPAKPGTYRVICTQAGHEANGMVAQFVVVN